ncbi:MAG: hypothetical protein K2Y31_05465 [Burkholderiales bacterium]|jgi:hypothetical protein|nr:hypothetical protein [Burkholderiales bacterium]
MRERVGSEATKRTRVQVIDLTRVEKSGVSANSINFENFNKLLGVCRTWPRQTPKMEKTEERDDYGYNTMQVTLIPADTAF